MLLFLVTEPKQVRYHCDHLGQYPDLLGKTRLVKRYHDTQHNDIQHTEFLCDAQHNDIQHNSNQQNSNQHNNTQHNNTQFKHLVSLS